MPPGKAQPNSGYAYIRTEIKALQWIRSASAASEKLQHVPSMDPKDFHDMVGWYTVAQTVSDDYNCAGVLLTEYKDSSDKNIHSSVEALLLAISATKDLNAKLLEMMEALFKATKPADIDLPAIARVLAIIKSGQQDAHNMTMMGVKMSTFAILRMDGDGEDAKPVQPFAYTITPKERSTLLADVRELAKGKKGQPTYVDTCEQILLKTLS